MSKPIDLRQIKDKAAKAVEKRSYAKAAELYVEIAQHEDDPDWRQRAGEAFRKANKPVEAAEQLSEAAEGYARGGFLLKAIAVCKVVLQLDSRHTATQKRLAELYALRDGSTRGERTASGSFPLAAPVEMGRTNSGNFAIVRAAPAAVPTLERAPVAAPAPIFAVPVIPSSSPLPRGAAPEELSMDTVELPAGAPMDVLPLVSVLGGRKSQSMPAIRPGEHALELGGSAYEIELEGPTLEPLPFSDESGPHRLSPPEELIIEAEPTRPRAPMRSSMPTDELDFSSVMDDSPPAPSTAPSPPRPVAAAPPSPRAQVALPPPRPPADELDFSGLIDDAPASRAQAPSALPAIPLFSSLTADELQRVIEGVELREFEAGQTIVRQGDPGVALFVIVHGRVQVVVEGPPRLPQATLGEGAFFGELALLTDFPRSATVEALEPTQLLEISRDLIARVIAESPDVLKVLLRFFRDRMLDRLLSTSPLFSRFAPEDARALVERFKFLEIDPKTRVIREGERSGGLYLLLCGDASVVQGNRAIAKLQPGDLFGEMSMLQRGPASASVDTHCKCWALQLPREDFQEIMLTYPQLLEFIAELADRRRAAMAAGKDGRVELY